MEWSGHGWSWRSLSEKPSHATLGPYDSLRSDSAVTADGLFAAYRFEGAQGARPQLAVIDARQHAVRPLDVYFSPDTVVSAKAITADGQRVAYLEGNDLVFVDTSNGKTRRVHLDTVIPRLPNGAMIVSIAWAGDAIEVVVGDALWSIDANSGAASALGGDGPLPGGWSMIPRLSRSPDGRLLAIKTRFGAFVRADGGAWRQLFSGGDTKEGPGTGVVWSPDSCLLAFVGDVDGAIVVAAADGSGAYDLVRGSDRTWLRPLGWLSDGSLAYIVGYY